MSGLTEWLDRKVYPGFDDNWDDTLFREAIERHLKPTSVVLDLGAGAGIVEQMHFRGQVARVCGVDLDPRVVDNPYLDEGVLGDAAALPYGDATFDVVFADNVMEHLEEPEKVFREINRVLKRGGVLLFKTPNRAHFMPLVARATPHWFHQVYNRWRGREAVDTFPTRYRANSRRQVVRLAQASGFELEAFRLVEGRPEYLRMWAPTYFAGIVYERLVNSSRLFAGFRILLIATLRKTSNI